VSSFSLNALIPQTAYDVQSQFVLPGIKAGKMKRLLLVVWCALCSVAIGAERGEVPVRTNFRVELTRVHQIPIDGTMRGSWIRREIEGRMTLCLVDLNGRVLEHVLNSPSGKVPADVRVESGRLVVRHEGRTYQYCPHGHLESNVAFAPVARVYPGLFGPVIITGPELISTPVYVEDTQWVLLLNGTRKEKEEASAPSVLVPTPPTLPSPSPVEDEPAVKLKGIIEE